LISPVLTGEPVRRVPAAAAVSAIFSQIFLVAVQAKKKNRHGLNLSGAPTLKCL
jgi:hypothetical protein